MRAALVAGHARLSGQLLHVIEADVLDTVRRWIGGPEAVEKLRSQAEAALQAQSARIAQRSGLALEPIVLEGDILGSLLEAAPEDALLVLGAQGRLALRQLTLGSTARRALYRRKGPVLVVKSEAHTDYQRILVAMDFSPHALHAMQRARALFPSSHIEIVHVSSDLLANRMTYASIDEALIREHQQKARDEAEVTMLRFLQDAGMDADQVSTRIESGDPARVLPALAEKLGIDLVVTGKQGRTALGDKFLGSISQHLLQDCVADVLVECQAR